MREIQVYSPKCRRKVVRKSRVCLMTEYSDQRGPWNESFHSRPSSHTAPSQRQPIVVRDLKTGRVRLVGRNGSSGNWHSEGGRAMNGKTSDISHSTERPSHASHHNRYRNGFDYPMSSSRPGMERRSHGHGGEQREGDSSDRAPILKIVSGYRGRQIVVRDPSRRTDNFGGSANSLRIRGGVRKGPYNARRGSTRTSPNSDDDDDGSNDHRRHTNESRELVYRNGRYDGFVGTHNAHEDRFPTDFSYGDDRYNGTSYSQGDNRHNTATITTYPHGGSSGSGGGNGSGNRYHMSNAYDSNQGGGADGDSRMDYNADYFAGRVVFVDNLSDDVTPAGLADLFGMIGYVEEVRLLYDRHGRPNGSADITFQRRSDAAEAIESLHNVPLNNRPMHLRLDKDA